MVRLIPSLNHGQKITDTAVCFHSMTEFTPGQAKRMHAIYNILRVGHKQ